MSECNCSIFEEGPCRWENTPSHCCDCKYNRDIENHYEMIEKEG